MLPGEIKTKNILKKSLFRSSKEPAIYRRKRVMVTPAANMDETTTEYILTIASPGFKREHFKILIDKNIITIAAEREASQEYCLHDHCEFDYHRWKRDFLLPDDAEVLLTSAGYKNGELVIRIPRGKTEHLSGTTHIYVY